VSAVLVAGALVVPRFARTVRLPAPVVFASVAAGVPAFARVAPPGRVRDYGTFMMQMWAYFQAFELPYGDHERDRQRLRVYYPIQIDRRLGRGVLPNARLQALRRSPRARIALDRALGAVYFLWIPQRHASMLWILFRHRNEFKRSAALVSGAFDLGWVIYTAFPTAPPWWARKHGHIPEGIHRVTVDASRALPLVPEETEEEADAANPWASMPSTHVASAAMIASVLFDIDRRLGTLAYLYAAGLSIAVVYLGEHYVVDVAAAAGTVLAIRTAEAAARRIVSPQ
jgi:membrane-associated phospholipid phosphatase